MEHRSLAPNLVVSADDNAGRNQLTGEPAPNVAQEELFKEKKMGRAVNCNDLELSTYLQALAEGYLPTFYSDTSQSVQSKLMSIASKSFRRGKKTVVFHGFPFLKMSRCLTESRGEELLTWFAADSLAKTSAFQEMAQGLTESDPGCGRKWQGSLAKYDPATHSLKTAQLSLLEDLTGCCVTLPRWGLMRGGELYPQPIPALSISENASGFLHLLPTPCAAAEAPNLGSNSTGPKSLMAAAITGWKPGMMWQTPLADDSANRSAGKWNSRGEPKLSAQVMFPTPTVCGNYNRKGLSASSGDGLATAVANWPTPTANSCNGIGQSPNKTGAPNLQTIVHARTYPTATATAYKGWSPNHNRASTDDRLDYTVERESFQPGQQTPPMRLNPDWVEWLMGWPIGHTDLKPLETGRLAGWQQQHSPFSVATNNNTPD